MIENLNNAVDSINVLATAMDSVGLDQMQIICGKDFNAIRGYMTVLTADYAAFETDTSATMGLLSCESIQPLYVDLVHDSVCTDTPEAGSWAFGALLTISFFSMMMITFRSAWLEVIKTEEGTPISFVTQPQDFERSAEDAFNDSPKQSFSRSRSSSSDAEDYQTSELEDVHIPDGNDLDDDIDRNGRF